MELFAAGMSQARLVIRTRRMVSLVRPIFGFFVSSSTCFADPKVLSERLRGHKDAVWSVAYHSSDNRLVSASSDGTVKLWEPGK